MNVAILGNHLTSANLHCRVWIEEIPQNFHKIPSFESVLDHVNIGVICNMISSFIYDLVFCVVIVDFIS